MATQVRTHAGHSHSHGHSHHHDTTYLTSGNKSDAGVKITRIGLYVNLAMAIGKGIGGYVFHSQALTADAVHSLADLVSDFMTLFTVSWALRPPTSEYPLGFGKVESLGSLGVSGLLLTGGVLMGWSSFIDLCTIYLPEAVHTVENLGIIGHGHSHTHSIPNIQAAWLAGGSVVVKEWLYHATMKVALERKSSVLESNAIHHRVDSLTGIAALISIAMSNIFPAFAGMDALGGLVISYLVIKAGYSNTVTALQELADAAVPNDVATRVEKVVTRALQETKADGAGGKVLAVNGVKAGQNYLLDVAISLPASTPLASLTAIEQHVRDRVGEKIRGARRVRVRFVTAESAQQGDFDPLAEFVQQPQGAAEVLEESSDESDNGNGHVHGRAAANGNGSGNGAANGHVLGENGAAKDKRV